MAVKHYMRFACLALMLMLCTFGAQAAESVLELPADTLRIEAEAFEGLEGIREILLPEGLEYIGARAFAGSGVMEMTIPVSVKEIDPDAFEGVGKDAVIHCYGGSAAADFFAESSFEFTVDEILEYTSWDIIDESAYPGENGWIVNVYGFSGKEWGDYDPALYRNLVIANTYEGEPIESLTIMGNAFQNDAELEKIVLPKCRVNIYDGAFYGCANLKGDLRLLEGLESLGSYAFYQCTGLNGRITVPGSVKQVGNAAFSGCTNIKSIVLGEGIESLGENVFYDCGGLTGELVLPSTLKCIGANAFVGCNALTGSLTLPDGLQQIDYNAFKGCKGFDGVLTVPGTVTYMGERAFEGCTGFTGLILCEGLQTLGDYTFIDCTGMTGSLTLPSTLTAIGDGTFMRSGFTGQLRFPAGVTTIGMQAFSRCTGFTGRLHLNRVTDIGADAFSGCTGFDGSLSFGSVRTIGGYAFENCTGFTGILNIPYTVTSIGMKAFNGCSGFTRLICGNPAALKSYCFAGLSNITTATIDGYPSAVYDYMFKDCVSLRTVDMDLSKCNQIFEGAFENCESLLFFDIPEPVWSISPYAFRNCKSLSGVMILPDTMQNIYRNAFEGCESLLGVSIGSNTKVTTTTFSGVPDDFVVISNSSSVRSAAEQAGVRTINSRLKFDGGVSGVPRDILYQGDLFNLDAYLSGEKVFSEVTAEILDDGGNILQKVSAAVTEMPCDAGMLLGPQLYFEKLPLGTYTFVLSATLNGEQVVIAATTFEVVPPPVRARFTGMNVVRNGVVPSQGAAFEGTMTCNYTIDRLTATLTGETDKSFVMTHVAQPGSTTYDLSALNGDIDLSALTPLDEYRFTLKIFADGKTTNLLNTTFIVSDSGKTYSKKELEEIAAFVSDWENASIFTKYTDGRDYIKDLGLADGALMVFQSSLRPAQTVIEFVYTGQDHWGYEEDIYYQQLMSVLADVDETFDLTETIETPWYLTAGKELAEFGKVGTYFIDGMGMFDSCVQEFAEKVNDYMDQVEDSLEHAEWMVGAADDMTNRMKNFENSLRILDVYRNTPEYESNASYRMAVNKLILDYSDLAGSAILDLCKAFADYAADEIFEMGIDFTAQIISQNNLTGAFSVVSYALKTVNSVMGWDEASEGKVELTTQQAIFANAQRNYVAAFDKVAGGDTSVETISQLDLWFRTAVASGAKTYDSLYKIHNSDIFSTPGSDESNRLMMVKQQLLREIVGTPFEKKD